MGRCCLCLSQPGRYLQWGGGQQSELPSAPPGQNKSNKREQSEIALSLTACFSVQQEAAAPSWASHTSSLSPDTAMAPTGQWKGRQPAADDAKWLHSAYCRASGEPLPPIPWLGLRDLVSRSRPENTRTISSPSVKSKMSISRVPARVSSRPWRHGWRGGSTVTWLCQALPVARAGVSAGRRRQQLLVGLPHGLQHCSSMESLEERRDGHEEDKGGKVPASSVMRLVADRSPA